MAGAPTAVAAWEPTGAALAPTRATCLRRELLVGRLAPRVAGLSERPGRRVPQLFTLSDEDLVAAVGGDRERAERFLEAFDPTVARRASTTPGWRRCASHRRAYPAP